MLYRTLLVLVAAAVAAFSQQTANEADGAPKAATVTIPSVPSGYVLGAGDQFMLEITDLEELNGKMHRIDYDGTVTLPLVGRLHAAGLTIPEFEAALDKKLVDQLKEPRITVTVTETLSQPVSILGAVNTPGVHQIKGEKSLIEVLSLAGGLKPDAGYRLTITRRTAYGPLPLPDAKTDTVNHVSTGEVSVSDILEARNPAANIAILPHDVITVPRSKLVYIMGDVKKPGGFTLEQRPSVSILQAVAMADGITADAAKSKTVILRKVAGAANRAEIHVDLKKIMAGKANDEELIPDDILYVPNSIAREVKSRAIETIVSTGAGILIWRGL